jgi:uncharacterized protein
VDGPTTRLHVRVSPGASRSGVVGRHGTSWKVRVTAAPERGKANHAVLDLLAEALRIPRAQVELVAGSGARDKVVALRGIDESQVERRLEVAAGGAK